MSELWGGEANKNAKKQEDIGDKILGSLAGGKGKQQKQEEAQKNWFANKVGRGNIFRQAPVFIALHQVNEMAGGGQAGELKEDKLDKGAWGLLKVVLVVLREDLVVDLFQQHILKQGDQVRVLKMVVVVSDH